MKKGIFYTLILIIQLSLAYAIWAEGTHARKPYETTWLKITKIGNGYVVYNYPSLWDDGKTKSPCIIRVRGDSLTDISFSDEPASFNLNDKIKYLSNSSYMFKAGNVYRFDYIDKANKIARWTMYNGYGKPQLADMYIDSLYNTFPIVDYKWNTQPLILAE